MDLDETDQQILAELRRNARRPVSELATRVGLSAAPVARRIQRLERAGVIRGYTVVVDEARTGWLEAFVELRLTGTTETDEMRDLVREIPEVLDVFTIAGDPDVLVRMRVGDVDHLQRVVNRLRRTGKLTGTKTLMVLKSWSRDAVEDPGETS